MATTTLIRPEVQLGTCPRDHGDLFRQYGKPGTVWLCNGCGLEVHGSAQLPATPVRKAS